MDLARRHTRIVPRPNGVGCGPNFTMLLQRGPSRMDGKGAYGEVSRPEVRIIVHRGDSGLASPLLFSRKVVRNKKRVLGIMMSFTVHLFRDFSGARLVRNMPRVSPTVGVRLSRRRLIVGAQGLELDPKKNKTKTTTEFLRTFVRSFIQLRLQCTLEISFISCLL